MSARVVATRVLKRVAEQDAYAAAVLDTEIGRAKLHPRDAGLATEIVYGSLRALPALDAAIARHLKKDAAQLDPWARAALRVAAYQILHLSRVPPHAAVNEAVEIVRRERGPKVAGFVNAVLRKIAAGRPEAPEPPAAIVPPAWLEPRLREALGPERALSFLAARRLPPPLGLRVSAGIDRDEELARLREAAPDAEVRAGSISPRAILVRHGGDPRVLAGHAEGRFALQEEGAQAVALALDAQPGERIADACAGRGGKTTWLAGLVGDAGHVTAIDLHAPKLARIGDELERLGVPRARCTVEAIDLSVGTGGLEASFDRVLVDAPCTGLGTVHRRPELLLRLGPDDPARMAALQTAILKTAARLVRPGGLLVYAVCSPTREEGAGVVAQFEAAEPRARRIDEPWPLATLVPDADGLVRIGPWSDAGDEGPDAFQIARWNVV